MTAEPTAELTEDAPAKVNLTLHVTGRRSDGYHLLDSLVVFPDICDRLRATRAPDLTLSVEGTAELGAGPDNLVLRAAAVLRPSGQGARIVLDKRLPVAAGIGGGSADAAAALRLLARLWGVGSPADAGLSLGADVPVCLSARAARMTGVGEGLSDVPALPPVGIVLVNPRHPVETRAVFAGLGQFGAPMDVLPVWRDAANLAAWLSCQRNDLEPSALALCPPIAGVLAALRAQPAVMVARMSGSGATCFGLCATATAATTVAAALRAAAPDWWVAAAPLR